MEATEVPEKHFKRFESLADSAVLLSGAAPPRSGTGAPHTGDESGRTPHVIVGSLRGRRDLDTMISDLRRPDSIPLLDQGPIRRSSASEGSRRKHMTPPSGGEKTLLGAVARWTKD